MGEEEKAAATQEVGAEHVEGSASTEISGQGADENIQGQEAKNKTVPYERLAQVSHQNQELRRQMTEMQERLEAFQTPGKNFDEIQKKKAEEAEFYKNPYGVVDKKLQDMHQQFQAIQAQAQDDTEYRVNLGALKGAPGFSQELEDAMVKVIREYGMAKLGKTSALKLAYQTVTGKPFGEWNADSYNTRQTKQRLMRPSAGGGSGQQGVMSQEQFANVPLEEYAKDPQKYNKMLAAWMGQQQ